MRSSLKKSMLESSEQTIQEKSKERRSMTTAPRSKGRRKARAGNDYAAISDGLDTLALVIKQTKNRKLLPIYKRLEEELETLDECNEIMSRALKRTKKRSSKRGR